MDNLPDNDPNPQLPRSGRIDETTFRISIGLLCGICWVTAAIRFYVRVGIQKAVSLDDFFLFLGLCCSTASIGLVFSILDMEYLATSLLLNEETSLYDQVSTGSVYDFLKNLETVLILSWITICSVKLSFLFLFRKVIDRLHNLVVYWWVVFVFVTVTSIYGVLTYILFCPYTSGTQLLECASPSGLRRELYLAISQVVVDIVGDLLILAIPIRLIWKIQIQRKQKFWLAASLCLTIVMIIVTPLRVAGFKTPSGQFDSAWEDFWNIVSGQVGLIMTSATAFRALYVSKSSSSNSEQSSGSKRLQPLAFIRSGKWFVTRAFHHRSWTARNDSDVARLHDYSNESNISNRPKEVQHIDLHNFPDAYVNGADIEARNDEPDDWEETVHESGRDARKTWFNSSTRASSHEDMT